MKNYYFYSIETIARDFKNFAENNRNHRCHQSNYFKINIKNISKKVLIFDLCDLKKSFLGLVG